MRNIIYSLICEDDAQKIFIDGLIERYDNKNIEFTFNNIFYRTLFCRGNKEVKAKLPQAANYSFLHQKGFYCDIVFVGLDYDDRERSNFNNELEKIYEKVNIHARSKVIILFPVQAIEHWLILLKARLEKPSNTKNIAAEVEAINRSSAKTQLYPNRKQPKNQIIDPIIREGDFDWLASISVSFRAFHAKLNTFLNTQNG